MSAPLPRLLANSDESRLPDQILRARLLSLQDVQALTTLAKPTIYQMIAKGRFPKPIKITAHRIAWRFSDVHEWIEARASA
ncbi:MAG: helix-turn-helix transcriptional regulator [Hyphomicrobium sp.]